MPASHDLSFSPPPNALSVWADHQYIYVLLPQSPGAEIPAPILTLSRNAPGLSKLLGIIYGHADNSGDPSLFAPGRKLIGTPAQHAQAQALLRRRGMIK